jgi:hypothetical protein
MLVFRSVFTGYNDDIAGFGFKIFCLGRIFFLVFVVTSPVWIDDTLQLIGLQGLLTATLFVEGLAQPRTTKFMNALESVEELVLFAFVEIGFAATGSEDVTCAFRACRCHCLALYCMNSSNICL